MDINCALRAEDMVILLYQFPLVFNTIISRFGNEGFRKKPPAPTSQQILWIEPLLRIYGRNLRKGMGRRPVKRRLHLLVEIGDKQTVLFLPRSHFSSQLFCLYQPPLPDMREVFGHRDVDLFPDIETSCVHHDLNSANCPAALRMEIIERKW
jgi:hypothetical protein